ncbi:DUF6248 family natural product biosynthesis protein [Kitasatospora sp. NPDC058162]|uniref:DUF6248 family natural product biosynthesis protein n=1 Tax=Kitasatospora sp. NPDC058162 TaxID=3346362 RepID=UPI0036D8B23F
MLDTDAEWIRRHVWTRRMRSDRDDTPDYWDRCICQWTLTGQCHTGRHSACRGPVSTRPDPETYLAGTSGVPMVGHTPVWLADRACRWTRCGCSCHTGRLPEQADHNNAGDIQLSLI